MDLDGLFTQKQPCTTHGRQPHGANTEHLRAEQLLGGAERQVDSCASFAGMYQAWFARPGAVGSGRVGSVSVGTST